MAHSIQRVGDRHAIFRDNDLIVLIALVRKELEDNPTGHEHARPVVADWRLQLEGYTPGCIMLNLDTVAASPDTKVALLHLFDSLRTRLAGVTEPPRATLATYYDVPDVPATVVIEAIDQLAALLRP
jgi:hypothetical protein